MLEGTLSAPIDRSRVCLLVAFSIDGLRVSIPALPQHAATRGCTHQHATQPRGAIRKPLSDHSPLVAKHAENVTAAGHIFRTSPEPPRRLARATLSSTGTKQHGRRDVGSVPMGPARGIGGDAPGPVRRRGRRQCEMGVESRKLSSRRVFISGVNSIGVESSVCAES
jgi:hypothetical protein